MYIASKPTTINGVSYRGSLRQFDPNNLGRPLWQIGFDHGVAGAATAAPGRAVVGAGDVMAVVDTSTGSVLAKKSVLGASTSSPAILWGAPSISNGVVYEGDTYGILYGYRVGGT